MKPFSFNTTNKCLLPKRLRACDKALLKLNPYFASEIKRNVERRERNMVCHCSVISSILIISCGDSRWFKVIDVMIWSLIPSIIKVPGWRIVVILYLPSSFIMNFVNTRRLQTTSQKTERHTSIVMSMTSLHLPPFPPTHAHKVHHRHSTMFGFKQFHNVVRKVQVSTWIWPR